MGAVPSARTMVLLINPTNPNAETQSKSMQQAALKLGLNLHVLNASTESDFDPAFAKLGDLRGRRIDHRPRRIFQCANEATRRVAFATSCRRSTRCQSSQRLEA